MKTEPQKEHEWLQKFIGEWSSEAECIVGPDQPPMIWTGSESVRSLGDLWIQGVSEMPGDNGPATAVLTLGYDLQKKRYVGTWIGSMMSHLWIYDGEVDTTGKILTLNTIGPDMSSPGTIQAGKMAKYQDIMEFKSDDHRVLTSQMLGEDGQWHKFVTMHLRRKK